MEKEKKKKDEKVRNDSEKMEKVMSFIVMKRLITPIKRTKAFKLGLVDRSGKVLKKPETKEEKKAFTPLDTLIFKIKRMLGSKLAQLNTFMYLQSSEEDFSDNIVVMGGLEKRGMVKRVQDDLKKLLEKYSITSDEFFNGVLNEEIRKKGL